MVIFGALGGSFFRALDSFPNWRGVFRIGGGVHFSNSRVVLDVQRLKKPCCVGYSNFLMSRCNGCSANDDYDDFGHFIFKADFENFLEFLDSRTQIVN